MDDSNVVVYDVSCNGSEDSLTNCSYSLSVPDNNDDISCDNAYVICQGIYIYVQLHIHHQKVLTP